jgi:hypothetical protein
MEIVGNRGTLLTLGAIAIFGGLIAYALVRGSDDDPPVTGPTVTVPSGTVQGIGVGFNSPLDGDTVTNPVQVELIVGGLRLQKAGEPVTPGFGHLGVIIDGEITPEGETFVADATHIDLADASHTLTLPELSEGQHTLSVIFMNAKNVSSGPLIAQTIRVNVVASP